MVGRAAALGALWAAAAGQGPGPYTYDDVAMGEAMRKVPRPHR